MEEEIKKLKLEIEVLKRRINELEKVERHRKLKKIIKIVFTLIIITIVFIFAYKWYKEITDYYNQINDFLNNPLKSFL